MAAIGDKASAAAGAADQVSVLPWNARVCSHSSCVVAVTAVLVASPLRSMSPAHARSPRCSLRQLSIQSTAFDALERDFKEVMSPLPYTVIIRRTLRAMRACCAPPSLRRAWRVCGRAVRLVKVLNTLVGDKSLERFRTEYERLHTTLKKSHDNEKRLINKCAGHCTSRLRCLPPGPHRACLPALCCRRPFRRRFGSAARVACRVVIACCCVAGGGMELGGAGVAS